MKFCNFPVVAQYNVQWRILITRSLASNLPPLDYPDMIKHNKLMEL